MSWTKALRALPVTFLIKVLTPGGSPCNWGWGGGLMSGNMLCTTVGLVLLLPLHFAVKSYVRDEVKNKRFHRAVQTKMLKLGWLYCIL